EEQPLRAIQQNAPAAGPPSPAKPAAPVPAMLWITPSGVTWRMRWLPVSAMKMSPASSTTTPQGESRRAAGAAPSSPDAPATPIPATVEIVPDVFTLRMEWLAVSAIKRLPAESVGQALGGFRCAKRGAPPSPGAPLD